MARIRTIKPEFPQSESMGRVSRDARLCFVLLWTLADDEGRARGNSRMLASLLFPYDDDAPGLIDDWLAELEGEGCIDRYMVDGTAYLQVRKWLSHQKIDRPSPSKVPPPEAGSRILANPRENSLLDQGSRIKDQGPRTKDLLAPSVLVPDAEAPGTDDKPAKGYEVPDCPHQELVQAYHEALPTLPKCEVLNDHRKGLMRQRWREVCSDLKLGRADAIEWWRGYFAQVAGSSFLTGRAPPGRDGRTFRADLEWLVSPRNFAKVVEGRYSGGRQ